jgi:magnesium transporter
VIDAVWMDLLDPDPAALAAALPCELHESAIARLLAPPQHDDDPRPRLETHHDYLFGVLVVAVPCDGDHHVVHKEVGVVATGERVVTVRKTPPGSEPYDCEEIRAAALRANASPGMCLYRLFDDVAERYLALVDTFDNDIDDLEDNIELWEPTAIRSKISSVRHDILHVRRVLTATRDAARAVLDDRVELDGGSELFPREVEIHFADAYDKLLRATDGLDLSRDLLAGVRDYHQAQVANNQNEVMKRLTVIASMLLLPAFIVGLYGMNVKGVPEYKWANGYLWAWVLIVASSVGQIIYFRRKRWL